MTRPNPWHVSQAPSGELYEKSAGSGGRSDVPQALQAKPSSKRSCVSPIHASARPSPSANAVANASTTRPRSPASTMRSIKTPTSSPTAYEPLVAGTHQLVDAEPAARGHVDARAARRGEHAIGGRLRRVAHDGRVAARAMHLAHAREQEAQVVADLGHRADGGAGVAHAVALLDGDRRRHAGDAVDVGPLHALEELPRVGRHRLDVAPLPFRIQRVEREARLARPGDAGHHGQRRARNLDPHVAQVVRARAVDVDRAGHSCFSIPSLLLGAKIALASSCCFWLTRTTMPGVVNTGSRRNRW